MIVEIDGNAIEAAEDLGRVLDALAPGDVVDVRVVGSERRGTHLPRDAGDEAAADRVPRALARGAGDVCASLCG